MPTALHALQPRPASGTLQNRLPLNNGGARSGCLSASTSALTRGTASSTLYAEPGRPAGCRVTVHVVASRHCFASACAPESVQAVSCLGTGHCGASARSEEQTLPAIRFRPSSQCSQCIPSSRTPSNSRICACNPCGWPALERRHPFQWRRAMIAGDSRPVLQQRTKAVHGPPVCFTCVATDHCGGSCREPARPSQPLVRPQHLQRGSISCRQIARLVALHRVPVTMHYGFAVFSTEVSLFFCFAFFFCFVFFFF